jgi:2-C-methyl-D-erythritol 4-phosphate cytidylyltransferase
MSTFAVILAAAGRSTRFAAGDPNGDLAGLLQQQRKKPFVDLKGRPVWLRAAEPFLEREDVVQTLVAVSPEDVGWFKEKFRAHLAFLDVEIVAGGAERADTVQNALARVRGDVDFVAVHDAARPLIVPEWIAPVFAAAERSGAAILALAVSATLKRVAAGTITETIDRRGLFQAQTPQVFRRELLLEAYAKRGTFVATDEAQLVERLGQAVSVVEGSPMNFKITTRADLRMAAALVDALPRKQGLRSLHPFRDEEPRSLLD